MLSTIVFYGARGRNRTGMPVLWAADFKSAVSTDFTTRARPEFHILSWFTLPLVDRRANFHRQAQIPNRIWYFSTSRTYYFLEKIFETGENLKLSKQRVFPMCVFFQKTHKIHSSIKSKPF